MSHEDPGPRLGGTLLRPPSHRWYGVDLHVRGCPPVAVGMPVQVRLGLAALADGLGERGPVDARALRLCRVDAGGRETEMPWQFTPAPAPRHPERRLRVGTHPTVSWVAEWGAEEEAPPNLGTEGLLTFTVGEGPTPAASYRLEFGVPRSGKVVQVPFPPGNLHCFDVQGNPTPVRWFPEMRVHPHWPHDGTVHFVQGRDPVASYHLGPSLPGDPPHRPYFYPVLGPDGIPLTDLGKPHDPTGSHAHHYSLWIAHASVSGADFWSERGGSICHQGVEEAEDGPLFCRLVQSLCWIAGGQTLLRERRTAVVHRTREAYRVLDLDLQLSAAGTAPVELGQTTFGPVAVRAAQSMTVFDGGGVVQNAEGRRNEEGAHRQRSRWIDQSGPVAPDRWAGIALMDHPDNPGHPTWWHCRNDGWAGASLTLAGPRTIAPDHTLHLRYRVVLHRGDALDGEVEQRYREFACAPTVELGVVRRLDGS